MCGIAGFFEPNGGREWRESLRAMTDALAHRGPDDEGHWLDASAGLALGQRRLSIIDLSPLGRQPMRSASGRYCVTFNGEIYNFAELRRVLQGRGHRFRGHSDTEVLLAAVEEWGVEAAVKRFAGMFAFALWDAEARALSLVRDRLGEKPLYYGRPGRAFLFASELKALRAHPAWQGEVDRDAVALLMRHNYIPAPHSIYKGVYKLLPGTILTLGEGELTAGGAGRPTPYWSMRRVAEEGTARPFEGDDAEAVDRLEALLRESVGRQMLADVPLGAFLSGGVDSSTVVALMQAQSARPVKTFTVGFAEESFNEAEHARAVARHLGTDHTELYVRPAEALELIPQLGAIYDEPFSDSSQLPTYLVARLARRHVTVCLSGDGGDELFCGYDRYAKGRALSRRVEGLHPLARRAAARLIRAGSPAAWDRLLGWAGPALPGESRRGVGAKLHAAADILGARTPPLLYRRLVSHWKEPGAIVPGSRELPSVFTDGERLDALGEFGDTMMLADATSYLPDDIMVKVDRASMAVSLESRAPMLDHSLVEFAWRLPLALKLRDGQGKWPLRQVLYRYVPRELVERPKMGFGVPLDRWLRGPLREWAEGLLDERRLREEGYFDAGLVREKWAAHISGAGDWQYHLWDVLMFQQWLETERGGRPSRASQRRNEAPASESHPVR